MDEVIVRKFGQEIGVICLRMCREITMLNRMWKALREHKEGQPVPSFADLMAVPSFDDAEKLFSLLASFEEEAPSTIKKPLARPASAPPAERPTVPPPNRSGPPKPATTGTAVDWENTDMKLWPRAVLVEVAHSLGIPENETLGQSVQKLRDMVKAKKSVPPPASKPVTLPPKKLSIPPKVAVNGGGVKVAAPFRLPRVSLVKP